MPKVIAQETMCCGHKRCPTATMFDDGSMKITDDDIEAGSVGTIEFKPSQVEGLRALLERTKI